MTETRNSVPADTPHPGAPGATTPTCVKCGRPESDVFHRLTLAQGSHPFAAAPSGAPAPCYYCEKPETAHPVNLGDGMVCSIFGPRPAPALAEREEPHTWTVTGEYLNTVSDVLMAAKLVGEVVAGESMPDWRREAIRRLTEAADRLAALRAAESERITRFADPEMTL